MGTTVKVYANAELKLVRLCWMFISGVRSRMPAKMMLYSTPGSYHDLSTSQSLNYNHTYIMEIY